MNSTTLYYYKPSSDIIIIDIVRQGCIYFGIVFAIASTIIYYNNQEEQMKLLRMFEELDDDFRRRGVRLKKCFLFAKIQLYYFGAILIPINIVFPVAHFVLEYKFWSLQFFCGSIGFYRIGINNFHLATVYRRFETLHEILIDLTKTNHRNSCCETERNDRIMFGSVDQMCNRHVIL